MTILEKVIAGILFSMLAFVISLDVVVFRGPRPPVSDKVVELHTVLSEQAPIRHKSITEGIQILPGHGICSGSFIDDRGTILTARHCVEGVDHMDVMTSDHQVYAASFIAKSPTQDLALVRINRTNTPFFKLATSLAQGDVISTLGSPLEETATLSRGLVAKLAGDLIFADMTVIPGNSGGAVYNERGEMVGVAVAVFMSEYGMTHLGVVEGTDAVRVFLKDVLGRKSHVG